jgi:iron complex outermembrane receptor protein
MSLAGGNKHLNPEKSKNSTLGLLFEPNADFNASIDFWWIALKHQIQALDDNTIFSDPVKYAALFHRAPDGSISTDGTQCPGANCGYIEDTLDNLGGVRTRGIDLAANYRLRAGDAGVFTFGFQGTYVTQYAYQNEEGGGWVQNAGSYEGAGPIFRWQQSVNINWTRGDWGLGIVNHYKSGYLDQDPSNYVQEYYTTDLYGTYQIKGFSFTLGVRNITDAAPPLSNQAATFQVGYDPRFADAMGRTYYARASYTF